MTATLSATLDIEAEGNVEIEERTDKTERDYWNSITLIDEKIEDLTLSVSVNADLTEGITEISLQRSHVKSRETDRVFHVNVKIYLYKSKIRQLRTFLGFLLKSLPP